jgi:hypothetical protein
MNFKKLLGGDLPEISQIKRLNCFEQICEEELVQSDCQDDQLKKTTDSKKILEKSGS